MSVKIGSARIDENGKAHSGATGDQTGKEVSTQAWYLSSKDWRVFRAKNPGVAEKIAQAMERACANPHIGNDQYQRNTLYSAAEAVGFDPGKVTSDVETDCSALVRVCCAFAGITSLPAGFCTANEPTYLDRTGAFTELKGSKYTDQSAYLGRGDILVTKVSGHTVVVLANGSNYEGTVEQKEYIFGERTILHGCEGRDVKTMQEYLLALGYDLGKCGADGDFGDATELAVKAFQKDSGIVADGKCGPVTVTALLKAVENLGEKAPVGNMVVICRGNCYVRSAPNTEGRILSVAHNGEILPYAGETVANGWHAVWLNGGKAWVSGKYGKVE